MIPPMYINITEAYIVSNKYRFSATYYVPTMPVFYRLKSDGRIFLLPKSL